jgi:ankyrin repeat protein
MGTLALHETDEDGKTALHWAVHEGWGQERMVRFLLVAGADSSIMDHELMTPRAVAEENEYAEIVAVFEVSECLMRSGRYLNYSDQGYIILNPNT